MTLDDVICPSCLGRMDELPEGWAVCGKCDYEAQPYFTLRQMLNGARTGATWSDVNLGRWTRMVARMVAT